MKLTATEQRLMDVMAAMDIIDCHEHLPAESVRTSAPQDVFTLFSHYTRHDLYSAGMDRPDPRMGPWDGPRDTYRSLFDYAVPLAQRWERFRPYWERIRHGSYARAAILTAQQVYGVPEISDRTYAELSARIAAENTPGIYRRILCDRCRIRVALTQNQEAGCERPLVPVIWLTGQTGYTTRAALEQGARGFGLDVRSLEDAVELLRRRLDGGVRDGAVGIKLHCKPNAPADAPLAQGSLRRLLVGETLQPSPQGEPLENYLVHQAVRLAAERGLVVALHAGIWGDFRLNDCKHLLSLAPLHPEANFDLYHLGMPFVRDAIVIARNLPNVFLNLCWTHIISQAQTRSGIDELLDQVPVNKVLAFGGDYSRPVEKIVGHLHMAREDYAWVFGARIDRGLLSFEDAVAILKLWFWDNPRALYGRLTV